jgi:hypothetical protein
MAGKILIKLEEEANNEIMVAGTDSGNHVRRLAMGKTTLRKKKRNNSSSKPQQMSPQQHWPAKSPTHLRYRVLLAAKEWSHSAPYVTWACA